MKQLTIFIFLNICNIICNIAMSIISPFYPTFAEQRGITEDIVGYIFAAHPMGQFITSIVQGKIINKDNRAKLMNIGICAQGVGLLTFGILNYFDNYNLILSISFIARFIGGFGASMFMTPFYAYIPMLFPHSVEQKIAFTEIATSLGFMIGPIFGSMLYSLGGFVLPFFAFGFLSLVLGAIMPFNYDNFKCSILEASLILNEDEQKDSERTTIVRISYMGILNKYPVIVSIISSIMANTMFTFYNPIMATYYEAQYDIDSSHIGYYMSVCALGFVIGSLVVSKIKNHKPFYIYFGLVICGYLCLLMGPDVPLTNIRPSQFISISSWGAIGLFSPMIYVMSLPQLNAILKEYYPGQREQCSNIASAIFNACLSVGELIGPIAGGQFASMYKYPRASSILGISLLVSSALYLPYLFTLKYK